MTLEVKWTHQFKKDYRKCKSRGLDMTLLNDVILRLSRQENLPPEYKDHALVGNMSMFRECHIKPDWLLIYHIEENILTLTLSRTGTHSDLLP